MYFNVNTAHVLYTKYGGFIVILTELRKISWNLGQKNIHQTNNFLVDTTISSGTCRARRI